VPIAIDGNVLLVSSDSPSDAIELKSEETATRINSTTHRIETEMQSRSQAVDRIADRDRTASQQTIIDDIRQTERCNTVAKAQL